MTIHLRFPLFSEQSQIVVSLSISITECLGNDWQRRRVLPKLDEPFVHGGSVSFLLGFRFISIQGFGIKCAVNHHHVGQSFRDERAKFSVFCLTAKYFINAPAANPNPNR